VTIENICALFKGDVRGRGRARARKGKLTRVKGGAIKNVSNM
jgi:hypothetical protein